MVSALELGYEPQTVENMSSGNGKHSAVGLRNSNAGKIRRRPGCTVAFDTEKVATIEVEHMEDLPGELIWYSREEYDAIKARNSRIVKLIKSGEFEENDEYSCRGLEHKLKEVFRQRRANKFNALNAVLEEQDRQLSRGIEDDNLIAAAYQTVSIRCQESANTIAFRDYRFSLNYCPNTPATGKGRVGERGGRDAHITFKGEKKKKKKDKKEKTKDSRDESKNENEQDDESLSPKKKKGVRKYAQGARRMMKRMSM